MWTPGFERLLILHCIDAVEPTAELAQSMAGLKKSEESDVEIAARVEALIANRKREDAERIKKMERSDTLGLIGVLMFAFMLSLTAQALLPVFAPKSKFVYYFLMFIDKLHFVALLFAAWRAWISVRRKTWDIRIYSFLVALFGLWSFVDLGSRCERYLRGYLFSEVASVEATITYSGYKGTGVGQRVNFTYQWEGKTYTDYEEFSNEYYFSREKKLKKGAQLGLVISKKLPWLNTLPDNL